MTIGTRSLHYSKTDVLQIRSACDKEHWGHRIAEDWLELHAKVKRLQAELNVQGDPEKADFYWDDRCLEHCVPNISDAVDGDDVGDVVTLRPIRELPKIQVRITEDGYELVESKAADEVRKLEE